MDRWRVTRLTAIKIALWLSQRIQGGADSVTWRSRRSWASQAILVVATAKEWYLTSALERETMLCLLEDQEIRLSPKKIA